MSGESKSGGGPSVGGGGPSRGGGGGGAPVLIPLATSDPFALAGDTDMAPPKPSTPSGPRKHRLSPDPPSGPSGGTVHLPGRKRIVSEQRKVVEALPGAQHSIRSTTKPISRMGNVVTNVVVSRKLYQTRKRAYEYAKMNDPGTESPYPDGHINVYDVMPGELLFRSYPITSTFGGGARRADEQSESVFSAFNLLETNREAVLVGHADDKCVINDRENATLTTLIPAALAGTRTIPATDVYIHIGDELTWGYPRIRYDGSGRVVPAYNVKGSPADKFLPDIFPLDFAADGQLNMYANLSSLYLGTFDGNCEQNLAFGRYIQQLYQDEDEWVNSVDLGSADVATGLIRSARRATAQAKEGESDATKQRIAGLMRILIGAPNIKNLPPAEKAVRARYRAKKLILEEARSGHYMFHIKRRFGTALRQGANVPIDVHFHK